LKKAAYPAEIGFAELKQQRRYATMSKDNVVAMYPFTASPSD